MHALLLLYKSEYIFPSMERCIMWKGRGGGLISTDVAIKHYNGAFELKNKVQLRAHIRWIERFELSANYSFVRIWISHTRPIHPCITVCWLQHMLSETHKQQRVDVLGFLTECDRRLLSLHCCGGWKMVSRSNRSLSRGKIVATVYCLSSCLEGQ